MTDNSKDGKGWLGGISPKTIKDLFARKEIPEAVTLPAIIPKDPFLTFMDKITAPVAPLHDFNGFWTLSRLLEMSISVGGYYDGIRFIASHPSRATHKLFARSIYDPKYGVPLPTGHGLGLFIHGIMNSNNVEAMRFCLLTCEKTKRHLDLYTASRLLGPEDWSVFAKTKDNYVIYIADHKKG